MWNGVAGGGGQTHGALLQVVQAIGGHAHGCFLHVAQQMQGNEEQVLHFNVGQLVFKWPFLPQIVQV